MVCSFQITSFRSKCVALPSFCHVAEGGDAMAGKAADGDGPDVAGRNAAEKVGVGEDFRASADFRRHLVSVVVADALRKAIGRAGGAR